MGLLLLWFALCASAYAGPVTYEKLDNKVLQERQVELLHLYNHVHEPINVPKLSEIAKSWHIEENKDHYNNATAVKILLAMLKNDWILPRSVPLSLTEHVHVYEVKIVFNVLYSAKDYETFFKTAASLREVLNEELFLYVLSVAIIHRPDTQGIAIPPMYEILPSYFYNAEIMAIAQRINNHGLELVEHYPSTYVWNDNVVIKWNHTIWPHNDESRLLDYFTHDYSINNAYYSYHLMYPSWLGSDVVPGLSKDRRGETWWYYHRQLLARYYMERLSNGLGEIPEISNMIEEKFTSGLVYPNGVPHPVRPVHYSLEEPELVEEVESVIEYERRIWEAIDKGFIVNAQGEHINILTEEGFDILGSLIEANADSVNGWYYKDFISIWKQILGNSVRNQVHYVNKYVPLVLPSTMENYLTALRDPATYMMWKRVLKLFTLWQKRMPQHTIDGLKYPEVTIKKVEVDKLVTYFEHAYVNITQLLHQNMHERQARYEEVSVLVQIPVLNHKPYNVRVHVKSEVSKPVLVKLFLGPKYDGNGNEIPLHENTNNFMLLDLFMYNLTPGDSVITHESVNNEFTVKKWASVLEMYEKAVKGIWKPEMGQVTLDKFPHRMILPKGKIGGMPFQLMVYIEEYKPPKVSYGTGFDSKTSLGIGTGARDISVTPLAFPLDRPLQMWQLPDLSNLWIQDVLIHHKHTPEVVVPHTE